MVQLKSSDGEIMVQLIHGDCLEKMIDIPDKSVDMILCDLPYQVTAAKWDKLIPNELLWLDYERIIKDRNAIALFGVEPFSSHLIVSNLNLYKYSWTWNKNGNSGFLQAKLKPMRTIENILIFSKGKTSSGHINNMIYNPQGVMPYGKIKKRGAPSTRDEHSIYRNRSPEFHNTYKQEFTNYPKNYLEFNYVNGKKCLHSTQKPVSLLEYLIKTYTSEGDIVLDNCMGSGSTGVACINTNRKFIGIEKDDKYFEIAKKRIEEASNGRTNI